MSETELISRLAAELAKQLKPALPVDIDLWDTEHVAAYLKRSYSTVRDKVLPLPNFPRAIRIQTANGKSHPLFKAREVIQWAESLQS